MTDESITECWRKDCNLNMGGRCRQIKEVAVLKNGTRHYLKIEECPFYKERKDGKSGRISKI